MNEWRESSLGKKTDNMVFKNHVFSLRIPNHLNQTAVGLFWLGKNNETYS